MREGWHEVLANWLLRWLPLFVSILWLMVSFIPLKSELSANARPMFGLMCIYFWTAYRSDLFSLMSVFVLGMISDVLSVAPLGIYLFMYLIMYLSVIKISKYINDKTFEILWIGLALLLPISMLSGWLLTSIYYADFLPLKSLLFSYLISIALYPIFGGINALVVNSCMQEEN